MSEAHDKYIAAHAAWIAAEIKGGRLWIEMDAANRARKTAWDRLVLLATDLSEDERSQEAQRQFQSPQETASD